MNLSPVLENEDDEDDDHDDHESEIRREQAYREGRAREAAESGIDTATHPRTGDNNNKSGHQSKPGEEHSLSDISGTARTVPLGPGPRDFVLEEVVSVTSAKV